MLSKSKIKLSVQIEEMLFKAIIVLNLEKIIMHTVVASSSKV